MSFMVTLRIYSGLADPSWVLSAEQAQEFWRRVRSLSTQTSFKALGIRGELGYQGFTVTDLSDFLRGKIRLQDGLIDFGGDTMSLIDLDRTTERWLLDTAPPGVMLPRIKAWVAKEISQDFRSLFAYRLSSPIISPFRPDCEKMAADAPEYDPFSWNASSVQEFANCYSYANDKPLSKNAVPGFANGLDLISCSRDDLIECAKADGLRFWGYLGDIVLVPLSPCQGWYVAVAISVEKEDFHFLRQDSNGCWSHKKGKGIVTNLDDKHEYIPDLRQAYIESYEIFAYMITDRNIHIA